MAFGQPSASFRPYVERAYAALTVFGESAFWGAVCHPNGGLTRPTITTLIGRVNEKLNVWKHARNLPDLCQMFWRVWGR
jgi:hypothetical protein